MAASIAEDETSGQCKKKHRKTGHRRKEKKRCEWLKQNWFLLLLLICTVVGYVLGVALRRLQLSNHIVYLIGFPGQLLLRAFFMIVVPILFCNLVLGVSSLRKEGDARMVVITIGIFLGLSTFSAIMGAVAGHLVHPGQRVTEDDENAQSSVTGRKGVILDSMLDLLWNSVPSNIIEATFTKEHTKVDVIRPNTSESKWNYTDTVIYQKTVEKKPGVNFMGLMMFSILFGSALAAAGDKGKHLHQAIDELNNVIMSLMRYFLNLLPLGMFFWMFHEGLQSSAPERLLGYLGVFLATTFGCIAFHQLVLLPSLYLIIVRKNPITFHLNLLPAILAAFGTASSAAALPATIRCAEEVNKLNRCVSRFVLPLGMAVHMNGGSFYITLTSIFLAQLEGITIGIQETVVLCLTCILLFISAPATSGGGNPVYLLTAMAAAGIEKPQFISLFMSMEWFMERFRTVMNVVADSYAAALVEKLCEDSLPEDDEQGSIEFVSPVIDGYGESTLNRPRSVCSHCGHTIDVT